MSGSFVELSIAERRLRILSTIISKDVWRRHHSVATSAGLLLVVCQVSSRLELYCLEDRLLTFII